jgi:hypothetical protein
MGNKLDAKTAGLLLAAALVFLAAVIFVVFRPQPLQYPAGAGPGGPGVGGGAAMPGPNSVTGVRPVRPGLTNMRR